MTAVEQSMPRTLDHASRSRAPTELRPERRFAAFDGMRAFAVLIVMFGHASFQCNGAIGVDIFFVLSGYLITSIILTELKKTGRLSFKNFYMRRFLRLLPALLLLIVMYLIWGLLFQKDRWERIVGDAGIALAYVANWTRAFGNRPKYIAHTWSLSIEEQFYLIWPLLTVGIYWMLGRWRGGLPVEGGSTESNVKGGLLKDVDTSFGFILCMAAAIALWFYRDWMIYHPGRITTKAAAEAAAAIQQRNFFRIYFGLDTRGDTLLAGAALAFWTPRIPRWLAIIVGWLGVLATVWYCTRMHLLVGTPYPNGAIGLPFHLVGTHLAVPDFLRTFGEPHPYGYIWVFTLLVLIGLLNDRNGLLSKILSLKPLAWIGVISYGLYLYHFPIMIQLNHPTEWNWGSWKTVAVAIPLTFTIATLSFYIVERPCLRLKDRFRTKSPQAVPVTQEGIPMPQETKSMPQNPDDLEHAPGFAHEKLEGWIPPMASADEIRNALEKAFDYRGDVTITKKDGTTVEGYIFDRRPGMNLADSSVRLFPKDHDEKISITYEEIAALAFSGKDTAAGKTWETWLKKYREKKAAGEKNIGLEPENLD
jgi:peptidoglycan/LPS O-acetylase OafA/YrhL